MTIQELRVGNFINADAEVTAIAAGTVYVLPSGKHGVTSFRVNQLEPIRLTEEWLLKFGFKKNKDNIYRLKDFGVKLHAHNHQVFRYLSTTPNVFRWVCLYCTECKYVHHLQNIYPVLMSWEELTHKVCCGRCDGVHDVCGPDQYVNQK